MRVTENYEEERRKEELEDFKKKVAVTIIATALAVTPAAVVYKIEQNKMNTMKTYYESLLQETNQASYLQGFFDALFGIDSNYYSPVGDQLEEKLINEINLESGTVIDNSVKKLSYIKKNTNQ